MKKFRQFVRISPKASTPKCSSYDARIPLDDLRVGKTLKLPINIIEAQGKEDDYKVTERCEIEEVYWSHNMIIVSFPFDSRRLKEAYKFALEDGGEYYG